MQQHQEQQHQGTMEKGVFWLELPAYLMHASRFPVDCPISYQHEEGRVIKVWILLKPDDSGMLLSQSSSQSSSQRSATADYQLRHDILIKTRQGNTILHEKIPYHQLQFPLKCPVSVVSSVFCNHNNDNDDGQQATKTEWIDGTILLQLEEENETENEHDNSDGMVVTQYCVRLPPTTAGAKHKRLNGVPQEALRYRPLENAVTNTVILKAAQEETETAQQQQPEIMEESNTQCCSLDETKKDNVMMRHGKNTIVMNKSSSKNNNETQRYSLDDTTAQEEHTQASAARVMQSNKEVDSRSYPIAPDSRNTNKDFMFTRCIDVLPMENIRMPSPSSQSSTTWIKDEFVEKETYDENVPIHESSREAITNIKIEASSPVKSTAGEQEESERISSEHYDHHDSSDPSPRKKVKMCHKIRNDAHESDSKDNDGQSSLEVKRETQHATTDPNTHMDTIHIDITAASDMSSQERCASSCDDASIATMPDICDSNVDAVQSLDILKHEAQHVTAEPDIATNAKNSIPADNEGSEETCASRGGDVSIDTKADKRDSNVDAKPSLEETHHVNPDPKTYMHIIHIAATSETSEICASRGGDKSIETKPDARDSNVDAGPSLEIKREFQHTTIFEPDTAMDINRIIATNDTSEERCASRGGDVSSIDTIPDTRDSSVDAGQSLDLKREAQHAAVELHKHVEAPIDICTRTVTSEMSDVLLDSHEGNRCFISELNREIQDASHLVEKSSDTPLLDKKHVPTNWLDRKNVALETESKVDSPLNSCRIPRKRSISQISAEHRSSHLVNNLSVEKYTEILELPPWLRSKLVEKIIFAKDISGFQDISTNNIRQCDVKVSPTKVGREGRDWTIVAATHENVGTARGAIEDLKEMLYISLSDDGGFRLFYELALYKQQEDTRIFRWKGTILRRIDHQYSSRGPRSSLHKINWRTTPPKHGTPTSLQRNGRTFHWCKYCRHYSAHHSSYTHSSHEIFMNHVRLPSYYEQADFTGLQERLQKVTGAKVRLVGQRDKPPRPYALLSGHTIDSVEQAVRMVESYFTKNKRKPM